jgi:hypothetical protein
VRTHDGGATWAPLAFPANLTGDGAAVAWIDPANPAHVFTADGQSTSDDGATWNATPGASQCNVTAVADTTSTTGLRLACAAPFGVQPVALASALLEPGIVDAPGSGLQAVAKENLLGDVTPDLTWASALVPTGAFGPQPPNAIALGAWPAAGGSTLYGGATIDESDAARHHTWVRRGTGRWWRLQAYGADLTLVSVLDATRALVSLPVRDDQRPLAVLDLAHPALAAPALWTHGGVASCVVPWGAADAETTSYAWLRDGAMLPGADAPEYALTDDDRGHGLACRATGRTDFGSTTATSAGFTVARAAVSRRAHLALTGSARAGRTLRCGATARITWFRDGKALHGLHARTFVVRRSDRGHTLACGTRRADGTLSRSRAVRIGRV